VSAIAAPEPPPLLSPVLPRGQPTLIGLPDAPGAAPSSISPRPLKAGDPVEGPSTKAIESPLSPPPRPAASEVEPFESKTSEVSESTPAPWSEDRRVRPAGLAWRRFRVALHKLRRAVWVGAARLRVEAAGLRSLQRPVPLRSAASISGAAALLGCLVLLILVSARHGAKRPALRIDDAVAEASEPSLDDLALATAGSLEAPLSAAYPKPLPRFTRRAGIAALDEAAADIASCRELGNLWGPGSIRATFSNDGHAIKVFIGPPYAGTKEGSCIVDHFKTAVTHPFRGPMGGINYFFLLNR
jgi:hypothetical protein